jgi:hypothetical protein
MYIFITMFRKKLELKTLRLVQQIKTLWNNNYTFTDKLKLMKTITSALSANCRDNYTKRY